MAIMRRGIDGLLMGSLVVLLAPGPVLRVGAQEHPDVTGAWTLNRDLTTRPGQHGEDRGSSTGKRTPVGGSGMPMGGGRGPGGMGGGYGGARANPEEMAKAREAVRLAMLMPERLTIVRDGETIVLTDEDGISSKLTADGKTSKSTLGALKVETKAKWDADVLLVERKFEAGVKITDRYSVSGTPRRLTIASKIENGKMAGERARTFQRVYELRIEQGTRDKIPFPLLHSQRRERVEAGGPASGDHEGGDRH